MNEVESGNSLNIKKLRTLLKKIFVHHHIDNLELVMLRFKTQPVLVAITYSLTYFLPVLLFHLKVELSDAAVATKHGPPLTVC